MDEETTFENITTDVITFADGSRIVIKVEVPEGVQLHTAGLIYHSLKDRLDLIERYAQYQQKNGK
jgi:hypothetical protein